MAGKKVVLEHPAYRKLIAVARELDKIQEAPEKTKVLVDNAKALVRGSIEVLMERDPLKHKLGMISLMLLESTKYCMQKIDGELVEVAEITDDYLFAWAVRELHSLPAKFK